MNSPTITLQFLVDHWGRYSEMDVLPQIVDESGLYRPGETWYGWWFNHWGCVWNGRDSFFLDDKWHQILDVEGFGMFCNEHNLCQKIGEKPGCKLLKR